jgi:hypothetical protein
VKKAVLFCLSLFLVVVPVFAAQGQTGSRTSPDDSELRKEPPPGGAAFGDAIFIRPFGFLAIGLGFVGTVASLPYSIPSGSVGAVSRRLIADPFKFTFTRPLGVFPEGIVW